MYILDSNEMPSILTLDNVAEYLRVHPSTIYRLLKKKQLPAFKLGRDWRFNRESIDRWCADAERQPTKCSTENSDVGAGSDVLAARTFGVAQTPNNRAIERPE